jgi:hypothetical protein
MQENIVFIEYSYVEVYAVLMYGLCSFDSYT